MKELLQKIGKQANYEINGLTVAVKVLDIKQSYGKIRYLITPIKGEGETWVEQLTFLK